MTTDEFKTRLKNSIATAIDQMFADFEQPPEPPPVPIPPTPPPDCHCTTEGKWSDPKTWGGQVPGKTTAVTVPAGLHVDVDCDVDILSLTNHGHVNFLSGSKTFTAGHALTAPDMTAMTGMDEDAKGLFTIGTEASSIPRTDKIIVTLNGVDRLAVKGMGGRFFGCMDGGTIEAHGYEPTCALTRLARTVTPGIGSHVLILQDELDCLPGDLICIATTDRNPEHTERRIVRLKEGKVLSLTEPLDFEHLGTDRFVEHDKDGVPHLIEKRAEVALLTRNVVIQPIKDADDENGFGVSVMGMNEGSVLKFSGVEIIGGGQMGIKGRYPWHLHGVIDGKESYLRGCSIHDSHSRFWSIHKTSNVTMENIVADMCYGHGFMLEDGKETRNTYRNVFGSRCYPPPTDRALLKSDAAPAVFWLTNPNNDLFDCTAVASVNAFWLDVPETIAAGTISADPNYFPLQQPLGTIKGLRAHCIVGPGPTESQGGWFFAINPLIKPGTGMFGDGSEYVVEDLSCYDCDIAINSNLRLNILTVKNSAIEADFLSWAGSVLFQKSLAVASSEKPERPATIQYDGIFCAEDSVLSGYSFGIFGNLLFWRASAGGWLNHCSCPGSIMVPPPSYMLEKEIDPANFLQCIHDPTDTFGNGGPGSFVNQPYNALSGSKINANGAHPDDADIIWTPAIFGLLTISAPGHPSITIQQHGGQAFTMFDKDKNGGNLAHLAAGVVHHLELDGKENDIGFFEVVHQSQIPRLTSPIEPGMSINFTFPAPIKKIAIIVGAGERVDPAIVDTIEGAAWALDNDRIHFKLPFDKPSRVIIAYE